MVRSIHKTNIIFGAVATILSAAFIGSVSPAMADESVTFNVNLEEVLTVSLTKPTTWASGNVNTLLRNKVTVSALTNNYYGATVSMYADDTQLKNVTSYVSTDASTYIDTLDNNNATYDNFDSDAWGYSLTDSDAGTASASYLPVTLVSSPVTVIPRTVATTGTNYTKDVFFGAKATDAKQSGTYAQTVNFVAVTGVIDTDNPVVPVNPSTDNTINDTPVYTASTNRTTYTSRSTNATNNTATTTTDVMPGNTTSTYANAAGVTASSDGSSTIVTALATVAAVTAVSGITFFALAKRNNDDDEEEEE